VSRINSHVWPEDGAA